MQANLIASGQIDIKRTKLLEPKENIFFSHFIPLPDFEFYKWVWKSQITHTVCLDFFLKRCLHSNTEIMKARTAIWDNKRAKYIYFYIELEKGESTAFTHQPCLSAIHGANNWQYAEESGFLCSRILILQVRTS